MRKRIAIAWLLALLLAVGLPGTSAFATENQPVAVDSKTAILVDATTGTVVFEKESDQQVPIASITKVMTLLLCFEALDNGRFQLTDDVVASANAAGMGGSQVLLEANGVYKAGDLLKSIIVSSGNDASVAMAEYLYGTEEACVNAMHKRAEELGMANTHFGNCTGLPVEGAHSTARDVSIMSRELIRHPVYFQYSTIWLDDLVHNDGRTTMLSNTNKLLRDYDGCDGIKTGSTNEAGFCVSSTAKRGDTRLIAVVLGGADSKSRFNDAAALLNYGFATYETTLLLKQGQIVQEGVPVTGSKSETLNAVAAQDLSAFAPKAADSNLEMRVILPEGGVAAPVAIGQVVGQVEMIVDGQPVATSDLISDRSVECATYGHYFAMVTSQWYGRRWAEPVEEQLQPTAAPSTSPEGVPAATATPAPPVNQPVASMAG